MNDTALARLNDLTKTVEGLKKLLARDDLPPLLVARALVDADKCASRMDRHAAALTRSTTREKG